ncbi:hypothetical protein AB1Y20_008071 [Prymnesium parvum]|uniref:Uncharacterized protein n=1 Tax=Prymnesium parvum TaxID=97485 RepID=A0AB34IVP1_PRYPA
MALTAEEKEAAMECENDVAASEENGGKRPAEAPPLGEPAPTRGRPPVGPHEDTLGGAATHTLPTPNTNHPPEEDASAESLFGQSTHPSEGVTPHGPRTASATARKPEGKVKKMGWLTVSCPANTQGQLTFADDSIKSGPWFFGFDNQWIAMRIAEAADGKLFEHVGKYTMNYNK